MCLGSLPYVDERTGVFGVSTICGWENDILVVWAETGTQN